MVLESAKLTQYVSFKWCWCGTYIPLHTPRVAQIEVVRYGKVRRAKLYYLRALHGKAARIKEIRR